MIKKIFSGIIPMFLVTTTASAMFSNLPVELTTNKVNEPQETPALLQADFMFKVWSPYIKYREDGHMLVCYNGSEDNLFDRCSNSSPTRKLEDFWKFCFPETSDMKLIVIGYSIPEDMYIFWLKR
jgi:hypothetical protein